MPDIEIVKLKLRRGTDTQRQAITLEQGELGYTTDAKRVWVGDGFTIGGVNVGNVAHAPVTAGSRTDLDYVINGDLVYDNNFLYQLSGTYADNLSSWAFIGSQTDTSTIEYNASNQLHIVDNGIGIAQLSSNVVRENGGLLHTSSGLSANVDGSTVTVDSTTGQLSVIGGTISTSSVGNGLSGGGADPLGVYTTDSFTYTGTKLEFNNAPANTVDAGAIQNSALGNGLEKSGSTIQLETIGGAIIRPFNSSVSDSNGRITSSTNALEQNLSGASTSGTSQLFFGSLDESNPGANGETVVNVISANSNQSSAVTISLSSAGFVQIASGTLGNFAIPVFKIPT